MKQAGKKTGNFSDGSKDPHDGKGLDWAAIRAAYEKRLDEEVARGVDNPETRRHQLSKEEQERITQARLRKATPKSTPSRSASKQGGSRTGPRVDVEAMVKLYVEENMAPQDIADRLGVNYYTVLKWLKQRQVFDKHRHRAKNTRPAHTYTRRDTCAKGHDLTQEGATRQLFKKDGSPNGRACVACTRARNNKPGRWATDPRNPKNRND